MDMDLHLITFGLIFFGMLLLFWTEKLPIDVSAVVGLIFFTIFGFVTPDQAFAGFASDAVILMVASFFVSAALRLTGIGDTVARYVSDFGGTSEFRCVSSIIIVSALVSSVMNNVAATAVMLPAVAGVALRSKVAPSKLFIPLSFGVLLGGTLTLIGTSSNMLASEVLRSQNLEPLSFLDFTPLGLVLIVFGGGFLALFGRKLLPGKKPEPLADTDPDLAHLYRLEERMFALRIPENSTLHGETLESLRFAEVLGAEVVAIKRGGETIVSPGAKDVVFSGDRLIVRGRLNELQTLFRLSGAEVLPLARDRVLRSHVALSVARLRPTAKLLQKGSTLSELMFRATFKVLALSIERNAQRIESNIAHMRIHESDIIRVLGESSAIEALKEQSDLLGVEAILPLDTVKGESVFLLNLPEQSGLDDVMIRESRLGELVKLTVIGMIRDSDLKLAVSGTELIKSGDTLIVAGKATHAERLAQLSSLIIEEDPGPVEFESSGMGLVEVVLAPRSKLIGKTLEEVDFAERYGFRVLAVWRDGEPRRSRFAKIPFRFGDALLLSGPRTRMHLFSRDMDFVVLSGLKSQPTRADKAKWSIAALAILVFLSALSVYPPHLCAVIAAAVAVLSGAITMEEAYREIEWRLVLLVACLLPLGGVVENLGISEYASNYILSHTNGLGLVPVLLILTLASSFLAQMLDSSITVVLLSPIAIALASGIGASPQSLVLSVAVGASIAFMTPFSHRCHLLILGPGGYKAKDFVSVGGALTVVCVFFTVLFLSIF